MRLTRFLTRWLPLAGFALFPLAAGAILLNIAPGNPSGEDTTGLFPIICLLENDTAGHTIGERELDILHHSRTRLARSNDKLLYIKTLTYIALFHEKRNNMDSASRYLNLALEMAERKKMPEMEAWTALRLYRIYRKTSRYSDGIITLERALADKGSNLNIRDSIKIYNRLGFFYGLLGKNKTAVHYYFRALETAKKTNDREQLAIIYNNIGNSYLNAGALGEALRYFMEGIESCQGEEEMKVPILFHNVARIYEQKGDYDLALSFLKKCLRYSSPRMYDNIAEVALHMSRVWMQKHQSDSAAIYAGIAAENALLAGESSLEYVHALIQLAAVNHSSHSRMKRLLYKAYAISDKSSLWSELNLTTSKLAAIYREEGMFDSAFFFLQKNQAYKDSLANYSARESLLLKIQEASLDSLVMMSRLLEIEKDALGLKVTNRNTGIVLITLLSGSLIILTVLLLVNFRRKRQYLKLDLELKELQIASRTKELLGARLEIEAQTEQVIRLKQVLKERLSEEYDAEFNDLSTLMKQAEQFLNERERTAYVQELIKLSDSHFHRKLKHEFPSLTDDELKLAGLIRLNLSSDELTRIFQISRESLNKKRYRLRKKLGLHREENLDQFIYDFN